MDITQFKHFRYGSHTKASQPFYALIDPRSRRFCLTSEDYAALKLVQFVVMPSKNLVSIRLDLMPNYQADMLDNSVCLAWTYISDQDVVSSGINHTAIFNLPQRVKLMEISAAPDALIDLQRSLMLILRLLDDCAGYMDNLTKRIDLEHNKEFIKFCRMVCPEDSQLIDIVSQDQLALEQYLAEHRNSLVRLLSGVDYSRSYADVERQIRDKAVEIVGQNLPVTYANWLVSNL